MHRTPHPAPSSVEHQRPGHGGVDCVVERATGLLIGATQVLSPHWDERPTGASVDVIVVHGISLPPGEFGGPWIDRLFCGDLPAAAHPSFADTATLRVSAHGLIRRDGSIRQYVPFGARAWHAGRSSWHGRNACNDFSVGIELEGTDEMPYADAQYAALAALIGALCMVYPGLGVDRVVGHCDVAPGRKSDPGPAFDWPRLRALLQPLP
ncbi:MAG: 1,6-anhydro-N-acetylmuramyl-L-alanine amidase AmpD [Steroidobacteraceae bacterium]